jgi:hypothetical protein
MGFQNIIRKKEKEGNAIKNKILTITNKKKLKIKS